MTACPFCELSDGFHDEDIHSALVIPPEKIMAPASLEKLCNCGMPFDSVGTDVCRNPSHLRAVSELLVGTES